MEGWGVGKRKADSVWQRHNFESLTVNRTRNVNRDNSVQYSIGFYFSYNGFELMSKHISVKWTLLSRVMHVDVVTLTDLLHVLRF